MTFRGTETSRCEVTIHFHGNEPRVFRPRGLESGGALKLRGINEQSFSPAVTRVTCSNSTSGMGEFQVEIRSPPDLDYNLVEALCDDDWVDISFSRGPRSWHVMRGLIDDVVDVKSSQGGATDHTTTITGRDFGKIFEVTPVFFNSFLGEDVNAVSTRLFDFLKAYGNTPDEILRLVLRGFFSYSTGGSTLDILNTQDVQWLLPATLPIGLVEAPPVSIDAVLASPRLIAFGDAFQFFPRDFRSTARPTRISAIGPESFRPQDQSVWSLATAWSDPPLCELYTDLLVRSGEDLDYPQVDKTGVGVETSPDKTYMAVIFRDRPLPEFVSVTDNDQQSPRLDLHPWFNLPEYVVNPQDIVLQQLGKSGALRRNTFMVGASLNQESVGLSFDTQRPLWDQQDILRHGVRRYDVDSSYIGGDAENQDLLFLSSSYRERLRDMHHLNAALLNGSIALGHGRPDIRVGSKMRVGSGPKAFTGYVEACTHSWDYAQGVRSVFTVTHGYYGSIEDRFAEIERARGRYRLGASRDGASAPNQSPLADESGQSLYIPTTGTSSTAAGSGLTLNDALRRARAEGLYYPVRSPRLQNLLQQAIAAIRGFVSVGFLVTPGPDDFRIQDDWATYGPNDMGRFFHGPNPTAPKSAPVKERLGIIGAESYGGYAGLPNYLYGDRRNDFSEWPKIWGELRRGQLLSARHPSENRPSGAVGLGQLNYTNAQAYYPSGRDGIGDALQEAIGLLRYTAARYENPERAYEAYGAGGREGW